MRSGTSTRAVGDLADLLRVALAVEPLDGSARLT